MVLSDGRIFQLAFKVIICVFFGIAIIAAAARIIIRLWLRTRLRLDDYLLLCSCVCLTAGTGLLYYGIPSIFFGAELTFNPAAVLAAGVNEAAILHQVDLIPKVNWAYLVLSWLTIFFVKFGFLSVFRHLVDRIPSMYGYWKGVLIFTGLVFAFAVCDGFIACPKLGIKTLQCSSDAAALNKSLAIGITVILLDMLTDVFILVIPVWLLWRVQIKFGQKLGLATFLCLSICMIIIAIVRVSGIHYRGRFDNTWIFMWQQVEACIAVTMLSLTAFRSVFVAAKPSLNNKRASPWMPSTGRLLGRHKKSGTANEQCLDDLTIPSATLTGLSRVFTRTKATQSMDESVTSDSWPLAPKTEHGLTTQV